MPWWKQNRYEGVSWFNKHLTDWHWLRIYGRNTEVSILCCDIYQCYMNLSDALKVKLSLPSINTFSKKINRVASKCHLTPVYAVSQSKETLTRTYPAEYGVRAVCVSDTVCHELLCSYNLTENHWSEQWAGACALGGSWLRGVWSRGYKYVMIMIYNDNFTDSSGVCVIANMEPYCYCGLLMFRFLCWASLI